MKIYLIEKGFCRQSGEILGAFTKQSDAMKELKHWQDVKERQVFTVVTPGLSEYDETPGQITGFWAGPKGGNTHAEGWRLREIEAI